jgi:signal transduction histidine kinase
MEPAYFDGLHVRLQEAGTSGMLRGSRRPTTPLHAEPELTVLGSASESTGPGSPGAPPAPVGSVQEPAAAPDRRGSAADASMAALAAVPLRLFEQFPGAVLLLDGLGRVAFANGIVELRLDTVRTELVGRDLFREVLPQLEAEGWGERFRAGMMSGRIALACETNWTHGRLGLGIRSFIYGGALGAFVLLEDRTALAAEEARRKRAEKLAAVGELAGGVAHEINNPLASIKGFAQLLARDAVDPEQTQALDIVSHECTRIASIIDNLLSFAEQQRTQTRGSMDLNEVVEGVLDLRQYAMETSGIELQRDLDPDLSRISGDRGALQRAVLALLTRAERVLDPTIPEPRVVVRTRESSDGVVLYVIDNGPEIPRGRLPHIFSSLEADEAAGGIGLGVAHSIVRDHGGHIWADSVAGQGSAFYVRLPRCEPIAEQAARRIPRPTVRSLPDRPLRVLVADDEPTLRLAITLFLGRHGHEVVQAVDAYEALRLATQQHFDVVLADVGMPGDGPELIRKLETKPELKGRTILMSDGEAVSGLYPSDRPHLTKPFDMTEVIRMVESVAR